MSQVELLTLVAAYIAIHTGRSLRSSAETAKEIYDEVWKVIKEGKGLIPTPKAERE